MYIFEFKDFLYNQSLVIIKGRVFRNPMNGKITRIGNRKIELTDLEVVRHCAALGIAPPQDLQDLYEVYVGHHK